MDGEPAHVVSSSCPSHAPCSVQFILNMHFSTNLRSLNVSFLLFKLMLQFILMFRRFIFSVLLFRNRRVNVRQAYVPHARLRFSWEAAAKVWVSCSTNTCVRGRKTTQNHPILKDNVDKMFRSMCFCVLCTKRVCVVQ